MFKVPARPLGKKNRVQVESPSFFRAKILFFHPVIKKHFRPTIIT